MTTTHNTNNPAVLESKDYSRDAYRIASIDITQDMYANLPAEVQQNLKLGLHIEGFMNAANYEWNRRNEVRAQWGVPTYPVPQFIGTVERALRLIALSAAGYR